jgi:hypothetical protein
MDGSKATSTTVIARQKKVKIDESISAASLSGRGIRLPYQL